MGEKLILEGATGVDLPFVEFMGSRCVLRCVEVAWGLLDSWFLDVSASSYIHMVKRKNEFWQVGLKIGGQG